MSNIIWTFAVRMPAASKTDEIRQPQKGSLKFEQTLNPTRNFLAIYFDFSWQKLAVRAVVQTAFAVKNESSQFFFIW